MKLDVQENTIDVAWRSLSATDVEDLGKNEDLKVHKGPGGEIREQARPMRGGEVQVALGEHAVGMGHERREQVELGPGQVNRRVSDSDLAAVEVHGQRAEGAQVPRAAGVGSRARCCDRCCVRRCPGAGAAEHDLDPGHKLAWAEGLGEVVVGADLQAAQPGPHVGRQLLQFLRLRGQAVQQGLLLLLCGWKR